MAESQVATRSASAERGYVFRKRCLVAVAVAEEAAAATRSTYRHNTHTPSLPSRENAQRARVEEGVGRTESRNLERGRESGADRERERERRGERGGAQTSERERIAEQPTADGVGCA